MTSEKNPNTVLRHERELRGWSQRRVAEEIGTSENIVSRWERGLRKPEPYFREKLCVLFGKNAEELGFLAAERPATPKTVPESVSLLRLDVSLFEHPDFKQGMAVGRQTYKEAQVAQLAGSEPTPFLVRLGVVMGMIDEAILAAAR